MKRYSDWILLLLAIMGCMAFFLPWVKLKSPWNPATQKLADSLQKETEPQLEWYDFIGLDELQREAIWQEPRKGITGYQLFLDLRENSATAPASRYFVSHFLGTTSWPEKAYLLVFLTLFPALLLVLLWFFWKRPKIWVWVGIFLLVLYLLLRWRIAVAEGALLIVSMPIGLGFWIVTYNVMLMALILLIRAAFPKSKI